MVYFQAVHRDNFFCWYFHVNSFTNLQIFDILAELPSDTQLYIFVKHPEVSLYISLDNAILTLFAYYDLEVM